ncbi:MAG: mercury methylation corrinoid protein HgcA [Spirochaetia bacterium]|nr:mercury methylation corrinoid protein HgcA [Spirochaetia bacterium]
MKFTVLNTTTPSQELQTGTTRTKIDLQPWSQRPVAKSISHIWTYRDYSGAFLSRISSYRDKYRVEPGLYKIGDPDKESDVLVSANYKLSFDHLRRHLKNRNLWIIVLDTKGINVWCAAGKGTFGTQELIQKINQTKILTYIAHKRIILPQLGGPGVNAHEVKLKTGLRVYYGPVYAKDIPEYFDNERQTSKKMRSSSFKILDRLVLTPMEINPAMKYFVYYAFAIFIFMGLQRNGIIFKNALYDGLPFYLAGIVAIFTGAFVTPLLLPFIPFRAFSVKGGMAGIMATMILYSTTNMFKNNIFLTLFLYTFLPMMSSFIALQFTGSTTFTNPSGVKKEHKYAIPVYITGVVGSIFLLIIQKVYLLGVL